MPRPSASRESTKEDTTTTTQVALTTANRYRGTAGSTGDFKLVKDSDIGHRPEGDFVTVKVHAVGLNFADVFACLGLYSATPKGEFTPGLEFAGEVEDVNPGVTDYKKGDKIFGFTRFGGYTSRIHADCAYIRPIPKGWTFNEAAAFPAQALTAWYGLVELGNIKKGDVVLIQSAAGGTGLWALKICKMIGAEVVATVGSTRKVGELLALIPSLRRTDIIDRSQCDTGDAIRIALHNSLAAKGRLGFNCVFDTLMGDWYAPSADLLIPTGRHVVLGAGSMTPHGLTVNWPQIAMRWLKRPRLDPLDMISQNKSVLCFNLIWLYENRGEVERLFFDLMSALPVLGKPDIGHVYNFEDMHQALTMFQSGKTVGKVVLEVLH